MVNIPYRKRAIIRKLIKPKMNMQTIKITDNINPILYGQNFAVKEFWQPIEKDFEIYVCLPKALQVLRDWASKQFGFEVPLRVTSTWRPNDSVNGPSAHRICPPAVDHCTLDEKLWYSYRAKIIKEMKTWQTSKLMEELLQTGTNVILFEMGCIHMHYRTDNLHITKKFGKIYLGEWGVKDGEQFNVAYSFND